MDLPKSIIIYYKSTQIYCIAKFCISKTRDRHYKHITLALTFISAMIDWRLDAYRQFKNVREIRTNVRDIKTYVRNVSLVIEKWPLI